LKEKQPVYPDPITPRSFPDLLARLDYDPFNIMPAALPPAPRTFTTAGHLARARQRLAAGSVVDVHCCEQLILSCKLDEPLPALPETSGPPDWGGPLAPWLDLAFRNALAWSLTDEARHRQKACDAMRLAADAVSYVSKWTGHEHHEAEAAARAYDLLAAGGLEPDDDNAFRGMLWTFIEALDRGDHRHCNNHNSMHMTARLAIGAALGHRQTIHDILYGHLRGGLPWRYGLIHTLRHDFLADGMQWEGVPGYHMLVLGMVCECFTIMENLGVDLWKREWPSTMQDDGFDEHRGWGPKGMKPLTAAFDALIYQAFPNGDYSLLHDQVLGNLRGAWVWWRMFNKAYEVYGDPRYAWVLRQINHGKPVTAGEVPVWFEGGHGGTEFVRLEGREYPAGEHPLIEDRMFSLTGKHVNGCSLFPMHGSAILRGDPVDEQSLGAYLYWGPHWAGHRAPAALHLDIHALGRRAATAPHLTAGGYDDPAHLTWLRSTIAHNTVTVDEQPMFPYDFDTESLWECDRWRDTISDGVLESFQAETAFKAIRASNDNVYAGVRLDRTVVLTGDYLLDVYRVTADAPRLLDWAMHCLGAFEVEASAEPVELGSNRGYRHFTGARQLSQGSGWATVPFTLDGTPSHCAVWLDGAPGARLILADDPAVDNRRPIGDLHPPEPRSCLIARCRAASALFVSLWSFGDVAEGGIVQGKADEDITIEARQHGQTRRWLLPLHGEVLTAWGD